MIDRIRPLAHAFLALLALGVAGAAGQTPPPQAAAATQPTSNPAPAAPPPTAAQSSTAPAVDTAAMTRRTNQEMGVDIESTIKGWQRALDDVETGLHHQQVRYAQLNNVRDQLQRLRAEVDKFRSRLQPRLDALKAQVDRLGPAPTAGQPEPEQVALNRAELNYRLGLLAAGQSAVSSAQLRIDQLINTVQDIHRRNFTSNLLQPVPGIYSSETWVNVPAYAASAARQVDGLLTNWWTSVKDEIDIAPLALEGAVLWLVLTFVRWRGVRRWRAWNDVGEPPFWKRASSAAGVILLRALPTIVTAIFLYNAFAQPQPLPEPIDWLFYAAIRSIILVVAVNALMTTIFAPAAPMWRLLPASDRTAARICRLMLALAIVYGLTTLIFTVARVAHAPFALTIAVTLPASLLAAGLIIAILRTPLDARHEGELPSLRWIKALSVPIWVIAIAIVVTSLTGYLALSRFLAQQLIVTGSILAVVYLLLLWVDGFAQGLGDESTAIGRRLKQAAGIDERREQLTVPISLFLKFVVLVCSVPFIMLQWGYAWPDILDWYRQLFFGFHIGNTQVSLAALAASIIVFILGYIGARLFQSWLDNQILKPAGISSAVRDSIRTSVGYIGILIAALAALSYAGFNLSNLAIVAGAFSVGIGFGLQSVISNFVSGLILLVERPIKIGDLVVVGGEEGYVRKISVRSTEIETFDRANVLVPNSYFITEKVKNWTFRNNVGRVVIPVGVAYGSDPRKVKAILLKVAYAHPNVMTAPEPFVDFEDFGASSLNFKLYAHIGDITKAAATRTDLRIAILDAFNEAGVVFPFPQTEVTIRDIDWVRAAVAEYVSGAHNGKAGENGSPASRRVDGPLQSSERIV
ncbi:MAG TPA: mechanosensitive ion channel domain-containing protein [Xanthobacteraceae bacterium]|nr:mechanosensitive ion channel domain-containing protein [Xanthobacteraceae bacterium]